MDRIVVLVDMDCFYVQVEQRLNPSLKGKPCAVVQYNNWKGGGIIAVGYEARAFGVTRQMRGDEAKAKCPSIELCRVPEVRGKADLTKYRQAGAEVIEVLCKFSECVERASIDEAYLDMTSVVEDRMKSLYQVEDHQLPNTFTVGWEGDEKDKAKGTVEEQRSDGMRSWLKYLYENQEVTFHEQRLAVAATIVEEMREAVFKETGFRCSAGIAHNKMLSKLSCGLHKPNRQTILPQASVQKLFQSLPIRKIRHLGGKLGMSLVEQLDVEFMDDIRRFSESQLQQQFGEKTGSWLYEVCRGIEREPVSARQLPKSIGCSKNFRGKNSLDTRDKVKHWLGELCAELEERLNKDKEDNCRVAKHVIISVRYAANPQPITASRSCALTSYNGKKIANDAYLLLQKFNMAPSHQMAWAPAIICLGISAGKFQDSLDGSHSSISSFMSQRQGVDTSFSKSPKGTPEKKERRRSLLTLFSQARKPSVESEPGADCSSEEDVAEITQGGCRLGGTLRGSQRGATGTLGGPGETLGVLSGQGKPQLGGTRPDTSKSNHVLDVTCSSVESDHKKTKNKSFFASFMARKVGNSIGESLQSFEEHSGSSDKGDGVKMAGPSAHISDSKISEKVECKLSCRKVERISSLKEVEKCESETEEPLASSSDQNSLSLQDSTSVASAKYNESKSEESKKGSGSFFGRYMARKQESKPCQEKVTLAKKMLISGLENVLDLTEDSCNSNESVDGLSEPVMGKSMDLPSISSAFPVENSSSMDESSNDSVRSVYSVDEIDMNVFDSLPWEIQSEIREFNKQKVLEEKKKKKGLNKFFKSGLNHGGEKNTDIGIVEKISHDQNANSTRQSFSEQLQNLKDHNAITVKDSFAEQDTVSSSQVMEMSSTGIQMKYSKGDSNILDSDSDNVSASKSACSLVLIDSDCDSYSKCSKCGKNIPLDGVQEHQDYHFAAELQCQMAGDGPAVRPSGPPIKRKSSSSGHAKAKKVKTNRGASLDKFFKQ